MRRTLFLMLGCLSACSPPPTPDACKGRLAGDLVITEFLNDPQGTDTGSEWIEIFNTLGTSLDLKGITLYTSKLDGSGLRSHVIRAAAPGGTLASRSYYVVGDVRSGALPSYVNYAYEADLSALSNTEGIIGIKCGSTTLDEVQYRVTPKAGHARQLDGKLTPEAMLNDDETKWCDSPTELAGTMNFGTPGKANPQCTTVVPTGNCIDQSSLASRPVRPPLPGQVFFTEVMADPKAVPDTEGEWLELRSTAEVDLNDVVLTVGTSNRTLTSTQCLTIAAGGYAILAHETDAGVNGGLPSVLATFSTALGNSGGTVSLSLEDAGIDTATFPASVNGIAWQLDPTRLDATQNDDVAAYCPATARYGDPDGGDLGTPGAANTMCGQTMTAGQCRDRVTNAMRAIVTPAAGSLYFTEVLADPKTVADSAAEWLELRSEGAADLNELVLTVGTTSRALSSVDCISVPAGGYALLAHNTMATANGGLPAVSAVFTQGLGNTGGTLRLGSSDGGVIDSTSYPAAVAGIAWQLNPTVLSATGNDDPMNYCRATMAYGTGGDLGTPSAANTACPAGPNPNECIDPGSGTNRPIVRPTVGQLAITEFMADPSKVVDTVGEYIEVVANASFDLNGLTLANDTTGMSTVNSQACLPVSQGNFALFARSADPTVNGGLPAVAATFGFDLANTAATGPRYVQVRSGTTTLDTFSYSSTTAGASWQLKPGLTSPDDNEDAGSVCVTPTMRYTLPDGGPGDRGTPGAANENCP